MDALAVKPEVDWKDSLFTILEMSRKFDEIYNTQSRDVFVQRMRDEFNFNNSTARKICKLHKHLIISDPQYADQLPQNWGCLLELSFLPHNVLIKGLNSGSLKKLSKYKIRKLRFKTVSKRLNNKRHGMMIRAVPEQSIIEHIREGIRDLPERLGAEKALATSKKLGVSVTTLRMIRAMIMLSERPELAETDRTTILTLLKKVDQTRNVKRYYDQAKPMMGAMWGPNKRTLTDKGSKKRIDQFLSAAVILSDTCDGIARMEIPLMELQEIDKAIQDFSEARKTIRRIADNLRRMKHGR